MPPVAPFYYGYLMAVAAIAGLAYGGWWTLTPAALVFVVVPVLDGIIGVSLWNPNAAEEALGQADVRYRWIMWLWIPLALAVTAAAIVHAASPHVGWPERIGLAVGIGLMNGTIGITYAHELVHRPGRIEPLLGELLLLLVSYPHFRVEHVFGHHRFVATPRDPATARFGETFYAFWPRSVGGQITSAWSLERERLARRGVSPWTTQNRMLCYAVVLLTLYAALAITSGPLGTFVFALQSLVAFSSLEVINYIEHYGLLRRKNDTGRYEVTQPRHSWNAGHALSNEFLINLARHSDHHAVASRRYQILRTFAADEVPQMPYGYGTMYLIALAPPLWFRLMNPRARAWA